MYIVVTDGWASFFSEQENDFWCRLYEINISKQEQCWHSKDFWAPEGRFLGAPKCTYGACELMEDLAGVISPSVVFAMSKSVS